MPELPEGTLTLLFSDIESSTGLIHVLGVRWRQALSAHRRIMRQAIVDHAGHEMSTEGDSFFVVFTSAQAAVLAAVEAQRALQAYEWPGSVQVRVRMGIHTGEPRRHEDGYIGEDVHLGARLAAAAHGGQVVISASTHRLIDGLTGVRARFLGKFLLKGFEQAHDLYDLVVPGLVQEFPPLRTTRIARSLRRTTELVGRVDELAALSTLIQVGSLVTVSGPAGSGKTTLALAAARMYAKVTGHIVYRISLDGVTTDRDIFDLLLGETGIEADPREPAKTRVLSYLADKESLVVLDNCEHLLANAAHFVQALLDECDMVAILATSQELLHLPGEYPFMLEPLAVPDEDCDTDEVFAYPAVTLLIERAHQAGRSFQTRDLNAWQIGEVARLLDGLPLAIELCAGWLGVIPTAEIIKELRSGSDLLVSQGARADPHTSLRATIAWSVRRTSPAEQDALYVISLFPGGADPADAIALCQHMGTSKAAAYESLKSLANKNLVRIRAIGGVSRYMLLNAIRKYAREELAPPDVKRRRSLSDAYRALLAAKAQHLEVTTRGESQDAVLLATDDDLENFREAIETGIEDRDTIATYSIIGALWRYWRVRALTNEVLRAMASLERLDSRPSVERARALVGAGNLAYWADRYDDARTLLERGLADALAVDDREWAIPFGQLISAIVLLSGYEEYDEELVRSRLEQSLEQWRHLGDATGQYLSMYWLATLARRNGNLAEAQRLESSCRDVIWDHTDLWAKSQFLMHLAERAEADPTSADEALTLYAESLSLKRRIGDHRGTAGCLLGLARLHRHSRPELGLTELEAALDELRGSDANTLLADGFELSAKYLDDAANYDDCIVLARLSLAIRPVEGAAARYSREQALTTSLKGFTERGKSVLSLSMEGLALARDVPRALVRAHDSIQKLRERM